MVVDTSVLIAILRKEADADQFERMVSLAEACFVSAVSIMEASMVAIGRGAPGIVTHLHEIIERLAIQIVPFDIEHAVLAREAFIRFGKGRHPAGLNMGDCASYALAKSLGVPLLYKGNDFSQTDIASALA